MIEHEIRVELASGAWLKILYFSDRELRWIFAYDYAGQKDPGADPEIVNKVRLTANYAAGLLAPQLELSMHVIVPERLGREFFAGMDISPGAKTYLEFNYDRVGEEYQLIEIRKGARERVRVADVGPAVIRPVAFPFPVPDRVPIEFGKLRVPFRTNSGGFNHFELPERTLR